MGLITKIWGPAMWQSLHSITFDYPENPTNEQKEQYKTFFKSLAYVLPCIYCRQSYYKFINEEENTKLTDKNLENRDSLILWLFNLHNRVNEKLNVTFAITFEEFKKKYESYRAKCVSNDIGCTIASSGKNDAYKNILIKDCSIISFEEATKHYELAKTTFNNKKCEKFFNFYNFIKKYNGDIEKSKQSIDGKIMWEKRNLFCKNMIDMIRCKNLKNNNYNYSLILLMHLHPQIF